MGYGIALGGAFILLSFGILSADFLFVVIFSMILRSLLYLYLRYYFDEYGMALPRDGQPDTQFLIYYLSFSKPGSCFSIVHFLLHAHHRRRRVAETTSIYLFTINSPRTLPITLSTPYSKDDRAA